MSRFATALAGFALVASTIGLAGTAEARTCKRLTKTEGAVVGAVAGGVLGRVVAGHGSTTGTVIGAGVGGVAGHEIAQKNRRKCRYYRR